MRAYKHNGLALTEAPPGIAEYREMLRRMATEEVWQSAGRGMDEAVRLAEADGMPDVDAWKLRCELDELNDRLGVTESGLADFEPDAGCPKCANGTGKGEAQTKYCPGRLTKAAVICFGRREEHLHRKCGRCGFEWLEGCVKK